MLRASGFVAPIPNRVLHVTKCWSFACWTDLMGGKRGVQLPDSAPETIFIMRKKISKSMEVKHFGPFGKIVTFIWSYLTWTCFRCWAHFEQTSKQNNSMLRNWFFYVPQIFLIFLCLGKTKCWNTNFPEDGYSESCSSLNQVWKALALSSLMFLIGCWVPCCIQDEPRYSKSFLSPKGADAAGSWLGIAKEQNGTISDKDFDFPGICRVFVKWLHYSNRQYQLYSTMGTFKYQQCKYKCTNRERTREIKPNKYQISKNRERD